MQMMHGKDKNKSKSNFWPNVQYRTVSNHSAALSCFPPHLEKSNQVAENEAIYLRQIEDDMKHFLGTSVMKKALSDGRCGPGGGGAKREGKA